MKIDNNSLLIRERNRLYQSYTFDVVRIGISLTGFIDNKMKSNMEKIDDIDLSNAFRNSHKLAILGTLKIVNLLVAISASSLIDIF